MKTQLFVVTSLMMTFLGFGCNTTQVEATPVTTQTEQGDNNEIKRDELYTSEAWKQIEEKWENMGDIKVEEYGDIYDKVQEEREDLKVYLDELIDGGYFSSITADAISFIYGDNLRSSLEETVELPKCYKVALPPEWDCTGVDTREELNKKLALIEELYEKGSVEKEVLDDVKKDIEKRLDLLSKADKYWEEKGEGTCEYHPLEVDVLIYLYEQNIGDIRENEEGGIDLIKASEYIVILEK